MTVFMNDDGDLSLVHDDDAVAYLRDRLGAVTVTRASHVEPDGDGWAADLSPSGGPVLRGFARRDEALAAEVAWLEEHLPEVSCG